MTTDSEERFRVTRSVHGMPSVQLTDATETERALVKRSLSNWIDDPWYDLHTRAGAFLQGDDGRGWLLIEFWQKDYAPYVAALNDALENNDHAD